MLLQCSGRSLTSDEILDGTLAAAGNLPPERATSSRIRGKAAGGAGGASASKRARSVEILHGGTTRSCNYRRIVGLDLLPDCYCAPTAWAVHEWSAPR